MHASRIANIESMLLQFEPWARCVMISSGAPHAVLPEKFLVDFIALGLDFISVKHSQRHARARNLVLTLPL